MKKLKNGKKKEKNNKLFYSSDGTRTRNLKMRSILSPVVLKVEKLAKAGRLVLFFGENVGL